MPKFTAPGAAFADEFVRMMTQQAEQRRQQLLDELTVKREGRLREQADATTKNMQANTEYINEERAARTKALQSKEKADTEALVAGRYSSADVGKGMRVEDAEQAPNLAAGPRMLPSKTSVTAPSPTQPDQSLDMQTQPEFLYRGSGDQQAMAKAMPGWNQGQQSYMRAREASGERGAVPTGFADIGKVKPAPVYLDPDTEQLKSLGPDGKLVPFMGPLPEGVTPERLTRDPKTTITNVATVPLSPGALDMEAYKYVKSGGVVPAFARGDKDAFRMLQNRAAELTPDDMARLAAGGAPDLTSNKADFAANQSALTQATKSRAMMGASEETATKNIDVFLKQAGKVVDSGSPLANTLLRQVTGKLLGSPDQAAFEASRQVAINEIATIITRLNSTGGLTTDTARREVESFNPANATLAQAVAVMRVLKAEMGNRIASLDNQVATLQRALRAAPSAGGQAPAASGPPLSAADLIKKYGRPAGGTP